MKKKLFFILVLVFTGLSAQNDDYILAENYFRNSAYEKAATLYKKLVDKSPYNSSYLTKLVACYQELDKFSLAESVLKQQLKHHKNFSFINVILGNNCERQHQQEKATEYYNKALQSIDKNPNYGETVAYMFKNLSKIDLAITAYKKIALKKPKSNYEFQIAQLYGEKGNFEKMFDAYINYVDKNKNYLSTVKRFTAMYITDDATNKSNVLFKKALLRRSASNPKNEWNDLLSWLFTKQKDYGKALIQQKALFNKDPNYLSGIKTLGKIAFENKNYDIAKQCFDFFIEKTNNPKEKFDAISSNLRIAIATEQKDIEEQFQQVFSKYGITQNTIPIQLTYANYVTFKKNNPEKATKILEKALTLSGNKYQKARIKLILASILVFQGNFNSALIYFSQIQTQFKNHYLSDEARFKVAQTSYFKNDFKWAKAQLKILKSSASKLIANDAVDLFLIISDNQPKDSISTGLKKYAKADLLSYQNKNQEAISVLGDIIIKFKGQPIEDEALFKQATLFTKQKEYNKAIENYTKIINLNKDGIYVDNAYYQMAILYSKKLNNMEKAKEYYQKIIFDYPSSIYLVDARNKYRKLRGDNL